MTSKTEKVCEIKKCVRCGYCCKQKPCQYGVRTPNTLMPDRESTYWCMFLRVDDAILGTYRCDCWENIKELEKNVRFPMCGSGCSSTLFNDHRHRVLQKIREMAVERLLNEQWVWCCSGSMPSCPECANMHGRIAHKGHPKPPLHDGCKCVLLPWRLAQ